MARKIKISAATLNIRLHPHSAGIYKQWIDTIFRRRVTAKVHGDRHGIISTINRSLIDDNIIMGAITTYIQLENSGTWFNSDELEEATEEQISAIYIPDNLHPNAYVFYFYFDLRTHQLSIQSYSNGRTFTPKSMQKLFQGFAADLRIMRAFGEAQISIVQDRASLEKLFSLERIKKVRITINRPNSDIFDDDFEKNIEEHLIRTHSKRLTFEYEALPGDSFEKTKEVETISKTALDNGVIEVIGRDEKGATTLRSDDFPQIEHDQYDPDSTSEFAAFQRLVSNISR